MRIFNPEGFAGIIFVVFVFLSCSTEKIKFNEEDWSNKVEATDAASLYEVHYADGRFYNPWMPQKSMGFGRLLKWKTSRSAEYSKNEQTFMPEFIPHAFERIKKAGTRNFILWIGHNTFLLRIDGVYWITDPMFSSRALLPKRLIKPALTLDELGKLTGPLNVIITHNHYDHLDKNSIAGMPEGTKFYVPSGLKKLIGGWTSGIIKDMDWWDEVDAGRGFKLISLPAQHWSRRIDQGYNRSLWAGYLLVKGKLKIYFGGDSGYFKGYREFGRKFGPVDYAFIPVTAYHPRWFMHYAHIDAVEALKAFGELKAKFFIPTQWGTFKLGDNPPGYPGIDLKSEIRKSGLKKSNFKIMNIGELLFIE